jgi:hypothetical protein
MASPELKGLELETSITDSTQQFSSSSRVKSGKFVTPRQYLLLMSAEEWEIFVCEWGVYQKKLYKLVTRMGGANDFGIDVACFKSDIGFRGKWDNFQCKYYKGDPLAPSTAIPEIGKILWHIFNKEITAPENYFFFAPKDCGPSLKKLLLDHHKLKNKLIDDWDKSCSTSITSTKSILLEKGLLDFVNEFDFSIFKYKPVDEVIEEYRDTPYFTHRFGGGLKDRPPVKLPPSLHDKKESNYIKQLLSAYSEHTNVHLDEFEVISYQSINDHFNRQREAFYSAESLRTFARDSVLPGTYSALQKDIFDGVIDVVTEDFEDGYKRVKNVLKESKAVPIESNGLFEVVRVNDRFGICHQLVNDQKIKWVKK